MCRGWLYPNTEAWAASMIQRGKRGMRGNETSCRDTLRRLPIDYTYDVCVCVCEIGSGVGWTDMVDIWRHGPWIGLPLI